MPAETSTIAKWLSPETVKSLGIPTLLCCAFMWIGRDEIKKASERMDRFIEFVMNTQNEQAKRSTAALENNTEVLRMIREDRQRERNAAHSPDPPVVTVDAQGGL